MKKKTKLKTKKGITLIALIITIAILIIITAVSISAFSDSGLIGKAMNASTNDKTAKLKEKLKLEINSNVLKEVTGENTENIENIFIKYAYDGKIKNEDGKRYIQLKENGEKIYLSDYNNEGLVTNGSDGVWSKTKLVCTPKLGEGMQAVYWDEEGNEIVQGDENFNIENWYNYKENINNENDSKWANAIVTDKDGNKSYFVWIPRYEYKINSDKSIDVNFISKDTKTPTEGYRIHPAFQDGTLNNYINGEWDKELSGIWVAKYEMSRTDAEIDIVGTATTFKSIPSVISARGISIGNMYAYCQNFDSNVGNSSLDSHLMKNSEWGAVAYLTHSKYGRNGTEININACSAFITGAGSSLPNAGAYAFDTTNFEKDYAYTTTYGKLASTTGNITGIYDLSGGAWEYVAGYIYNSNNSLNNGKDSSGNTFVAEKSTKYATVYPHNSDSDNSGNNYRVYRNLGTEDYGYGDALCETTSWNRDYSYFASFSYPFFHRGGNFKNGAAAGIFSSKGSGSGDENDYVGFRAVLAF